MVLVFIVNVPFLALAVIAELEELRFRVLILIICRNAGVEGNLHFNRAPPTSAVPPGTGMTA